MTRYTHRLPALFVGVSIAFLLCTGCQTPSECYTFEQMLPHSHFQKGMTKPVATKVITKGVESYWGQYFKKNQYNVDITQESYSHRVRGDMFSKSLHFDWSSLDSFWVNYHAPPASNPHKLPVYYGVISDQQGNNIEIYKTNDPSEAADFLVACAILTEKNLISLGYDNEPGTQKVYSDEERLEELKYQLDIGLISQEDYEKSEFLIFMDQ